MSVSVACAWAVYTPDTADLAAQAYRAQLFATHGFLLWDNNWYGGHYLPGYSLLFPPLAAALGLRLTGVLLVPPAAFLFARSSRPPSPARPDAQPRGSPQRSWANSSSAA